MKDFCVTWARYTEFFPPIFECSTSPPEYLWLAKPRGKRRKRGSRAGVGARLRKHRGKPPCPSGSGSVWDERCLRPVPIRKSGGDSPRASPSLWSIQSDRIFLARRPRNSSPRERVLCPVTCRGVSNDHILSSLRCPDGQRAPVLECAQPTRIALLNARSIANKAFFLSELFSKEHLDFLFLTETWQREMEYTHLNELRPPDSSVFGTPRVSRRGGGLVLVYRDRFCCRLMDPDSFDSFELQMTKNVPSRLGLLYSKLAKAFFLSELFSKEHLDFLFLTETWQREMEYTHLNELRPPDCSVFGTPRDSRSCTGTVSAVG
ncbi:hypothetical protein DPX16_5602 [Anabarilius grahami]|uniref:Uncharacterized protein n=1 Tax=Anabarilius grahami TaxID=495550 RepID=A0A3N0Y9X1_ANAGA|nr:hypothetical protein DPX16_5602 [Anabarilius grahami]